MIPQEALGGGFTSRVIFIVEEKKRKLVPEYVLDDAAIELGMKLTRDLERIAQLTGEIRFEDEAKELYKAWYVTETEKLDNGNPAVPDRRFAGYCERRATHLRKLMLVCSACRGDDLLINTADFHKAHALMKAAEVNMG